MTSITPLYPYYKFLYNTGTYRPLFLKMTIYLPEDT